VTGATLRLWRVAGWIPGREARRIATSPNKQFAAAADPRKKVGRRRRTGAHWTAARPTSNLRSVALLTEGVVICFGGQEARAARFTILDGLGFRAAISASNKICHGHQPNKITMVA
jgi:hypothetical protein